MSDKIIETTALPLLTTVAGNTEIVGASGNRIKVESLRPAILGDVNLELIMSNIFIMCHRERDNFPLMVKPHKWASLQRSGEIADGVVIVEGGKVLVVAPTEADSAGILWSSASVSGGATTTKDRVTAMYDWNGRANTTAIIAASSSPAVTNTAAYAPGFCNLYSRVNANGYGLTAGKWWLPSAGEMMMIYANMTKINYCLSLISGATQLLENWYWTSTEHNASNAWNLGLSDGYLHLTAKASARGRARPVSAFIQ